MPCFLCNALAAIMMIVKTLLSHPASLVPGPAAVQNSVSDTTQSLEQSQNATRTLLSCSCGGAHAHTAWAALLITSGRRRSSARLQHGLVTLPWRCMCAGRMGSGSSAAPMDLALREALDGRARAEAALAAAMVVRDR